MAGSCTGTQTWICSMFCRTLHRPVIFQRSTSLRTTWRNVMQRPGTDATSHMLCPTPRSHHETLQCLCRPAVQAQDEQVKRAAEPLGYKMGPVPYPETGVFGLFQLKLLLPGSGCVSVTCRKLIMDQVAPVSHLFGEARSGPA